MPSEDAGIVKVDVVDVVAERIAVIEKVLEAFVENANREIAAYNGALAELRRLKRQLEGEEGA